MNEIKRREFLRHGAQRLLKLSTGLYVAGRLFPWPAQAAGDLSVFDDFPIPEITPVDQLYHQQIGETPDVEPDSWRLKVAGAVENPLELDLQTLAKIERFSIYNTLKCVGDPVGGRQAGHLKWTGVRLKTLLERARVKREAKDIALHARDGYSDSFPVSKAMEGETLLALEMNGVPLTGGHGWPARMIVPNIYGMKNVKWIDRIEVTDYDYEGYWQKRGWSETAVIKTFSTIMAPSGLSARAPVMLAGVAYAGDRGVLGVQVSLDGGSTWDNAITKPAMSKYSWRLWAYKIKPSISGKISAMVRAVEKSGKTQKKGGLLSRAYPAGADGYHEVTLLVKK